MSDNKISCDIIKDLLPLYVDGVCSDESKILVSEHLDGCEECSKEYKSLMSKPLNISADYTPEKESLKKVGKKLKKSRKKAVLKGALITLAVLIIVSVLLIPDVMIAFAKYEYDNSVRDIPVMNMNVYNHKDGKIKVGKVKLNIPEKYATLPNGLKIERNEDTTVVWMTDPNQLETTTNQRIVVFDIDSETEDKLPKLDFSTEAYGGQPDLVRFMDRIGVKELGFGVDDYNEFMYYLYSKQNPPKYSFFSSFSKKAAVFAYYNCMYFMVAGAKELIAFDTGEYKCYGFALQGTAEDSFDYNQAGGYNLNLIGKNVSISLIGFTKAEVEYIMSSIIIE